MRNVQLTSDFTRSKPVWLVTHEQQEGLQASLLRKCGEAGNNAFGFHLSKSIDMTGAGQQNSCWRCASRMRVQPDEGLACNDLMTSSNTIRSALCRRSAGYLSVDIANRDIRHACLAAKRSMRNKKALEDQGLLCACGGEGGIRTRVRGVP